MFFFPGSNQAVCSASFPFSLCVGMPSVLASHVRCWFGCLITFFPPSLFDWGRRLQVGGLFCYHKEEGMWDVPPFAVHDVPSLFSVSPVGHAGASHSLLLAQRYLCFVSFESHPVSVPVLKTLPRLVPSFSLFFPQSLRCCGDA